MRHAQLLSPALLTLALTAAACGTQRLPAQQECFGAAGITNARATPSCAPGLVYANGACVPRESLSAETTFLCDPGDEPTCRQQCDKGSDESCNRLAGMLLASHKMTYSYGLEQVAFNDDEDTSALSPEETSFFAATKPLIDRMRASCEIGGAPNACVAAAAAITLRDDKDDLPKSGTTLKAFAALMEQGCRDGQDLACGVMEQVYGGQSWADNDRYGEHAITPNIRKLEGIIAEGCDTGSAKACSRMGYFFTGALNLDPDFKPNYKKSARYWSAACLGGVLDDCIYATAAYVTSNPDECARFFKEHLSPDEINLCLGVPCEPDEDQEIQRFCRLSAGVENKKVAYFTASKVCGDDDNAEHARLCQTSETLKSFAAQP